MPVKIRSYGGPITWVLRKYNSNFTSKIMLSFASMKYKKTINSYIAYFMNEKETPIFANCMIETINRCNGSCEFCPANKKEEQRPLKKMTDEMFYKIIYQLHDIGWKGKLYLNINNEPFLDKRILKFAQFAKSKIPDVFISVFSNGTLLTPQKIESMVDYIDELVLNDYSERYILSKTHRLIYQYIRRHKKRFSNMNIIINRRYGKEILATRAGNAPNKPKRNNKITTPCIYPFLDFLIFPDGMVGMCCNDCKEVSNFGNIAQNTLLEIWNNKKFYELRSAMMKGRDSYLFCQECDVVDAGEREKQIKLLQKRQYNF